MGWIKRRKRIMGWHGVLVMVLTLTLLRFPPFNTGAIAKEIPKDLYTQTRIDAERDAETDINGGVWVVGSILVGVTCCPFVGPVFAYFYAPNPPPYRLIGKSPEYVFLYTEFYKKKAKKIQAKYAWIGCGISGAIAGSLALIRMPPPPTDSE